MKIRNGFVSNSSSSSYVISIKKHLCEKCTNDNTMLLKFFLNNLKQCHDNYAQNSSINKYNGEVKYYLEYLEDECEELEKDLAWVEKELFVLGELSQNKDAVELFGRWDQIKDRRTNIRFKRMGAEANKRYKIDSAELKDHMEYCAAEMNRRTRRKEELQSKIEKLSKALDENDQIFIFELDNMDPNQSVIKDLLKTNWVNIIEWEQT